MALTSGLVATLGASLLGEGKVSWTLLGFGAAVVPGLGAGMILARRHGQPGPGFLVALGTGILARFVVVLASLAWALRAGDGAYRPWLLGVALGYVPMELFEIVWFHRQGKHLAAAR